MQILGDITEDQMIGSFLNGELNSVRFFSALKDEMKLLNINSQIIREPNFLNSKDNLLRRKLFGKFREYGENKKLFENFPTDIQWKRVSLSSQEVLKIRYINYSYWDEISKQTHSPITAAETIEKGEEIFGVSNKNFLKAAEFLRNGGNFPEMVLVAKNEDSQLIVLEGHLRLTAYSLASDRIPKKLIAVVGFSENISNWGDY